MSQTYTLCEVRQNNGKNGKPVWIVIKGSVYDLTKFLEEHPGGEETIMEYAGKDATKPFNQVGHSTDAMRDMKLYKIGTVANECMSHLKSETAPTLTVITTPPVTKSVNGILSPNPAIMLEKVPANPPSQCCGNPEEKKKLCFFCCF